MYTIQVDVQITRRKRFIVIHDKSETVYWTGTSIADALAWLFERGEEEAVLKDERNTWNVAFDLVPF